MRIDEPWDHFQLWLEGVAHLLILRFLGPGPAEVFALWLAAKRRERKKVDHVRP